MQPFIEYFVYNFQPLSGLILGVLILIFVCFINWYGDLKHRSSKFIEAKLFQNDPRSEMSANGVFMTLTSFLVMIGGILIVVAMLFLNN